MVDPSLVTDALIKLDSPHAVPPRPCPKSQTQQMTNIHIPLSTLRMMKGATMMMLDHLQTSWLGISLKMKMKTRMTMTMTTKMKTLTT